VRRGFKISAGVGEASRATWRAGLPTSPRSGVPRHVTINLRTAKALGLTNPPSLLLRAGQVLE
jgi:hypothetical protein